MIDHTNIKCSFCSKLLYEFDNENNTWQQLSNYEYTMMCDNQNLDDEYIRDDYHSMMVTFNLRNKDIIRWHCTYFNAKQQLFYELTSWQDSKTRLSCGSDSIHIDSKIAETDYILPKIYGNKLIVKPIFKQMIKLKAFV